MFRGSTKINLFACLVTASVPFFASQAFAASFTYDVDNFSLGTTPSDVGGTLNGTITTDKDSGKINASDISSYNLTISIGSFNLQITNSNSFVYAASSGLGVTPTQFLFDFEAVPNENTFFFTLSSDSEAVLDFDALYADGFIPSADLEPEIKEPAGPLAIGAIAATPIPGALPLFAGGLGVIGLLGRRKKMRKHAAALAAA